MASAHSTTTSKPLEGSADISYADVAALLQSVELATQLARELCAALRAQSRVTLYDAATSRTWWRRARSTMICSTSPETMGQNQQLQSPIEEHSPPTSAPRSRSPVALAVIPAIIKNAADLAALFKSDVALTRIGYGEGARDLFASALFKTCPQRISGLSTG